jgi:uncharacterized iron-regulated membrane protein
MAARLGVPEKTQKQEQEEAYMKKIRMTPLFFRRIHKWVGLIIGIQFILWSVSGAMMALIDMEAIKSPKPVANGPLSSGGYVPPSNVLKETVQAIAVRNNEGRPIYEVTLDNRVRLFDAQTGDPIAVDEDYIRARAAEIGPGEILSIERLDRPNLEARAHTGPVWRVDFADEENSSAYYSASTGRLLELRGDSWRLWDFFWMLHNMDYINRSSFNHPLIVVVAFATLFLSGTGFYLLFKSFKRRDFSWVSGRKIR